ncbi:MAG: PAS domain S-box protein [Desulfobacteraceae bacterium]
MGCGPGVKGSNRVLSTVGVPEEMRGPFERAQDYVSRYFQQRVEDPTKGLIEIAGERYILVRAASLSKEFFDLVSSLYRDRGEPEARGITFGFLFDIAHSIGKADARSFFAKMEVSDPIEKLSAGPVHFSHTGWAFVDILPESNPTPDDDYYLIYDHPFSFEAHTWLEKGGPADFPVCVMNAGYSSGWCEESFGVPLVAAEIECRAKGDDRCRFIMAPPSRIKECIARYGERAQEARFGAVDIPEFFQRKRLEDELIKSEETVRALLNAPKDRALLLDRRGRILALNETAARAFGRSQESLIGRDAFALLPSAVSESRRDYHEQALSTGRSLRYQDKRDGRWMDTTVDPVKDAGGRVARVAVVSRDMTAYKQMQEALRKEKEFNATLIQTSPAFFVAVAPDGRTLLMNEAMLKALGYAQEEVIGRNYSATFVSGDDRAVLKQVFQTAAARGDGPAVVEHRMITKDGRELFVEWHSREVRRENGEPDFFFALGIDVTQRRRAENELRRHRDHLEELVRERTERLTSTNLQLQREISERIQTERALQESESMLQAIFDQTFQFIGILKLDGTVVRVNKTAMDFVGASGPGIEGRPFWETPWWTHSREEQARLRTAVHRAARGDLVRYETTNITPKGEVLHVDISIKPVKDQQGRIVWLISEGRDISDLKLAVEDLRKREDELKAKSRSLQEANIALKVVLKQMEEKRREDQENVLSNLKQLVLPYIGRLKRGALGAEEKTLLEIVESNLDKITSPLISRLSSSSLGLTPMEIRVAQLVREGLTNKEIAGILGVSLNTVSSHRYKIRSKLGLKGKGKNLRSYLLSLEE